MVAEVVFVVVVAGKSMMLMEWNGMEWNGMEWDGDDWIVLF